MTTAATERSDTAGPNGAPTPVKPQRRRPRFHPLPVAAIDRLTDDAVAVTFDVPDDLRAAFDYQAGQYLTLRRPGDDSDVRRSYSICAPATTGRLRVGVKKLPGGALSEWVHDGLRIGDLMEVMTPYGTFTTDMAPTRTRRYAAFAAGSGITPVLSLAATALEVEPQSRFTLFYGNRTSSSVMFLEELADLKDAYPDRFQLVHVLSREPGDVDLFSGRLDDERIGRLLDALLPPDLVDEWFLCGPLGMVESAQRVLTGHGVPRERIRTEIFFAGPPLPTPEASPDGDADASEVTVLLDGRASTVAVPRHGRSVLESALTVRSELPFACKGGVCSTCRARIVEGEVRMDRNYALEPEELDAGYVLTCQSHPVTDRVTVDYDA